MFNHARTLLLNIDGSNNPGPDFFGEEAVPADFRRLDYPSFIRTIRARLFGAEPDRSMLNYRLRQFMRLLHSTQDLAGHVTAFDPRITYVDSLRTDLFEPESFQPVITQLSGAEATLHIQDGPSPPDVQGKMWHRYTIDILSGSTVRVRRETIPRKEEIFDYTFTAGLSRRIEMFGSGYGVLMGTNNSGVSWQFEVRNRPTFDLGQITAGLENIGETVFLELFGVPPVEPFLTYKRLWEDNRETVFKLGGLLLALIARSDEVRRSGNG